MTDNPGLRAVAVWSMLDRSGTGSLGTTLEAHGPTVTGHRLAGDEFAESLKRQGDGFVAVFPPASPEPAAQGHDDQAWFSLDCSKAEKLRPSGPAMSLSIRVKVHDPGGWGTLFASDWLGLAIERDGLAIAFVGVTTPNGSTYREIPLAVLEKGLWLDLVVRIASRQLEFFCNGVLRVSVGLQGKPISPFHRELSIGGFSGQGRWPNSHALFLVDATLDSVAVWHEALTDADVAFLAGRDAIEIASADPASLAIAAYNDFWAASERKDLARCRELEADMRSYMAQDPTRPVFHLTAPIGWIFDPSGAFHFEGRYHVFSYHHIYAMLHFSSHDHYVSGDLIRWRSWPLGPMADGELDVYGIWLSNHVVDDDGNPNAIYGAFSRAGDGNSHGVRAISRDGMVSYEDKRVVIPKYHDGHVWREGDTWYCITMRHSSAVALKDPEILIFTSSDLDHWTERGVFFRLPDDYVFTEFPYLISLDGRDVLMAGCYPGHDSRYWVGTFDRESFVFIPDEPEGLRIDYANSFHVFNPSIVDDKGPAGSPRRVMMVLEARPHGHVGGVPWKGALGIPRVLTRSGSLLHQEPVTEIEMLRGAHDSFEGLDVTPDGLQYVMRRGDALEIIAEFENIDANVFGLLVRLSNDRQTSVRIFYDAVTGEFGVSGNIHPVAQPSPALHEGRGPSYVEPTAPVRLRVFLDKSIVEVFLNGQTCTTSLEDPDPANVGVDLFADGGSARCTRIDIWEMASNSR